jgi:hypothetical protein
MTPSAGAAQPDAAADASADANVIHWGWRGLLVFVAALALTAAAFIWFPASPTTVKTQQVTKRDTVVAPQTKTKKAFASRATKHRTRTTTTTIAGRLGDATTAKPAGSEGSRSETLTIALLAGALVLLALAAIGRAPTKLAAGSVSAEWAAVAPKAAATLASEARRQGVEDPEQLRAASERLFGHLAATITPRSTGTGWSGGPRWRRSTGAGSGWGTSLGDDYIAGLARESLETAAREPKTS